MNSLIETERIDDLGLVVVDEVCYKIYSDLKFVNFYIYNMELLAKSRVFLHDLALSVYNEIITKGFIYIGA